MKGITFMQRLLLSNRDKTPTETSEVRIQKTSAETFMDTRQNIHAETSHRQNRKDSNRDISG